MKKNFDNLILLILIIGFVFLFRYSNIVQSSIIESSKLWFMNLVPFMFSTNLVIDLLINYGLGNFFCSILKKNYPFLIVLSLFLGCPANVKYISDFYKNGYISKNEANWLMLFAYSPNPLFIIGITPTTDYALIIIFYIYLTNLTIGLLSKKYFSISNLKLKRFEKVSFSKCVEASIFKSFNVLILILGIISIYGTIIKFINIFFPNCHVFFKIILEMTNGLKTCYSLNKDILLWMIFASSFAGLSIHTQIKSILEDTDISYKYFLFGRLIASIPILVLIIFN